MPPTPAHAWPLLSERLGATAIVKHENHTPIGALQVRAFQIGSLQVGAAEEALFHMGAAKEGSLQVGTAVEAIPNYTWRAH